MLTQLEFTSIAPAWDMDHCQPTGKVVIISFKAQFYTVVTKLAIVLWLSV
jgi:hypothetical protein